MATQILGQPGGNTLFPGNSNMGMALANDMYGFHDISKAELVAPQLIMLANVALNGEVGGSGCDYQAQEERQMAELTTVGYTSLLDGKEEEEEEEGSVELESDSDGFEYMEWELSEAPKGEAQKEATKTFQSPSNCNPQQDVPVEDSGTPESADDKSKGLKSKPFRCKPCQYEAESEKEFVHHIKVHSAKKFIVGEDAEKQSQIKESDTCTAEEADFSKGPIRCNRCGYNTNRYDHYLAHLKHHNKAGESERVYKCTICTYTTVSEYHWKKHLRNHFPRKVYTCSQCSYFSDRKNNYIQHIRTHTGERPYQCSMCPYSSSQKTHLTRHMRTHSGEKPFKCEQCSYVAANQHEVTRHARQVHNGPKPLTCPHCDYKTADRSNFKKHVELHVNPRQFLCPVCDYAASKKCNLQYHIKSRHPDCSDITMDVSKVKLRTKKCETDFSDSATSEKSDREHKKFKGEAEEKKEKAVKPENRESSKDKKASTGACVGQVTTRSQKAAPELKNVVDERTEKSKVKFSKRKGVKRKAEIEPTSVKQDFTDDKHVTKKKMKLEHKTRDCQEIQKKHIKRKASKKQKSCLKKGRKKKVLRNKYKKKMKKLAAYGKGKEKLIPEKPVMVKEDSNGILDCSDDNRHKESESTAVASMTVEYVAHVVNAGRSKKNELPIHEAVEMEVKGQELPAEVEQSREITNQTKTGYISEYQGLSSSPKELSSAVPCEQIPKVLEAPERHPVGLVEAPDGHLANPMEVPDGCPADPMEAPDEHPANPVETPDRCTADPVEVPDKHPADPVEAPDEHPADLIEAPDRCTAELVEASDEHPADPVEASDEHPANPMEAPNGYTADLLEVPDKHPSDPMEAPDGSTADLVDTPDGYPADAVEVPEERTTDLTEVQDGYLADPMEVPDGCPANPMEVPDGRPVDTLEMVDRCPEGLGYEDHQKDSVHKSFEIKDIANQKLIEDQPNTDTPTEQMTQTQCEQNPKEAVFVHPQCNTAVAESVEMDEDEGIHSHDGSDISDNISERSDDSGLNSAQSIPEIVESKAAVPESVKSRVTMQRFMCIFCDRTFRKEGEYSKHLNRHLVNVYYLEKAAKGQE
ncbi:RE1-silencing transcription factor [Microcaecilia unicolor]|uniref:RE1-silencing transcription factor n=1 Tax=Microcaecilia unicolor TaxID=1415580 RepID=A0A6P7XID3_9AMPH|nr:RE1-silencing transcription factor [Microcaecilia unicolor]